MMGTQPDQVAAVQQLDKNIAQRREQQLTNVPLKRPQLYRPSRSVKDIKYTFHSIKVLPEFTQQDKARQLLERLRDDRGVRAIMEQRRWSVGELIELSPVEASILGYNRNAGQLIAVRLRTDDFSGFRHYDSVRKVLLHELTHNVWSEHDDNFHALNRQLNKDVVALDWTAHGGHQIDSKHAYYQPEEEYDDEQVSVTWEAGTYRLGGNGGQGSSSSRDGLASAALRREQAAQAALSRLTKQEEQEMDEGCGS
ncbi:WLM domain-domain-containing protein [Absidia repens]|uniref:WLM domain-domain-containing protein n=1 Tax=Absidia repens TaxID=90262 RepID=A0A1X2J0Z4_9FUNG|nr:WLM domain-domain-containing protein [Absidia repens]